MAPPLPLKHSLAPPLIKSERLKNSGTIKVFGKLVSVKRRDEKSQTLHSKHQCCKTEEDKKEQVWTHPVQRGRNATV